MGGSCFPGLSLKAWNMTTDKPPPAPDRLFIGVYPCGIAYADRAREEHGDYARLAFLDFGTLGLDIESNCPVELRTRITADAAAIQAQRGQQYRVSTAGQTVTLGGTQ